MDSIRVSEAPDPSSILGEATKSIIKAYKSLQIPDLQAFLFMPNHQNFQ